MHYNTTTGSQQTCEVILSDSKGAYCFSSGNIVRLQAQDNYTIVYFEKRRPFMVSKVLKTYEEMLAPYGFVRTHRSHLINTSFVSGIDHFNVIMQDDSVVELSKRNKTGLKRELVKMVKQRAHH